jgi:phosphohistidine phosphatase
MAAAVPPEGSAASHRRAWLSASPATRPRLVRGANSAILKPVKLYLAQHGTALAKTVDPARSLSEEGRRDVQAMAKFLQGAGIQVERVWHSGKRRAEQTAQLLAKAVAPHVTPVRVKGINPDDSVDRFISDADVWEQDTLVVGHLPFVSRLVAWLTVADPEREIVGFLPASVVCLERRDTDAWTVLWMLRPELLARE